MQRVIAATRVATLVGDFDRSPAYLGLAEALRHLIVDGRIPTGTRLPSERELTTPLLVSRTTVTRAYAELRDRGYLVSRQGSGSVATLPHTHARRGDHLLQPGDLPDADAIDLTCAAPTPAPGMLAVYEQAMTRLPALLDGVGYFPSGLPALQEAIAGHYEDRGLPTRPDQVIVVPGALAALSIAAQAVLGKGDRVLIESPSYPNAIASMERTGARLVGVEPGPEGWEPGTIGASVRQARPRAAYLIPDFHNPTGALADDAVRAEVAAHLGRHGVTAVVDESMVQLALDGQRMPAPFGAHHRDTISIGSLSKPYWGGVRVGWLRAGADRVDDLLAARLSMDLGVSPMEQLVALELLRNGGDLLAHRRAALRESRDAAASGVRRLLPDWRFRVPAGGLNLWCELPSGSSSALTVAARDVGVALAPGPSFAPEGGLDRFLRLPFTQPADRMVAAVERIAQVWPTVSGAGRQPAPGPTMVA